MCVVQRKPVNKPSPRDIIKEHQIFWNTEEKSITVHGVAGPVWVTGIADTNSMLGLMDYGHTVLLIQKFDKSKLAVGDIVVYRPTVSTAQSIIHRIVEIGTDKDGRWYKTRGDNCFKKDPYLLRDVHIMWLCVGIIY